YDGTSAVGSRIFNVAIEGETSEELSDIDLSAFFGHQVGGVLTKSVTVSDGSLDVSFIHGAQENPLINGIEILGASPVDNAIQVITIADQISTEGETLDNSLVVSASGGDGQLSYSIS